jgi:cobalt-zinc-cadmium efflux system membrane fusion protein
MKFNIKLIFGLLLIIVLTTNCSNKQLQLESDGIDQNEEHEEGEDEAVHLSMAQFNAINIKVDTLTLRNVSNVVNANGQLEVPPQNEASVTAIIGANISSILVIEGEEVKKGQTLAYLAHPNLTQLQGDYLETWNKLQFLEQDYNRQKQLYEANVGSGKAFQQTQADYRSAQGKVTSFEAQLRLFGMNPARITEGIFYDTVPIVSPIDGTIVKVEVKTGQFVQPDKELFEIVNTHHIHADLMVFEKDVYKVEVGQQIRFTVETMPGQELFATIYSVGKKFEQEPKAVHIHAEIENKTGKMIPGMYIKGEILTGNTYTIALPEGAIVREGDTYFAFLAEKEMEGDIENWMFTPIEVSAGNISNGWISVEFFRDVPVGSLFAMNNAYYLMAEMKKGEAEHSH